MNNSQPALRLMEFDVWFLRVSAPSFKALTSSNIVPARIWWVNSINEKYGLNTIWILYELGKSKDSCERWSDLWMRKSQVYWTRYLPVHLLGWVDMLSKYRTWMGRRGREIKVTCDCYEWLTFDHVVSGVCRGWIHVYFRPTVLSFRWKIIYFPLFFRPPAQLCFFKSSSSP